MDSSKALEGGAGVKKQGRLPLRRGPIRRGFIALRSGLVSLQIGVLRRVLGMDIGEGVGISLRARLDFTNPRGIHIGNDTYVAFGAVIFAHDMSRVLHTNTYIGANCFIGANAIIMPGVRVGDCCIVGSGAVVTRDVPVGSIVVGNPAKVVRSGIRTERWGRLPDAIREQMILNGEIQASDAS